MSGPGAAYSDSSILNAAFPEDLRDRIGRAIFENENLRQLFADIASYVVTLRGDFDGEHVGKKRKIADQNGDGESMPGTFEAMMTANMNSIPKQNSGRSRESKEQTGPVALTVKDVSFSMPVRKKLTLEITLGREGAIGGTGSVIRGVNQGSGDVEFVVGYEDIEHIFRLPVPEKAQKQTNFIIIPKNSSGITPAPQGTPEPILFTVQSGPGKTAFKGPTLKPYYDPSTQDPELPPPTYDEIISLAISPKSFAVTKPTDTEFASTIRESHRKSEVAYHVKAFRGSKEGYLFFLPNGIFFGFKKPLLFFEFAAIGSISYTSVLQRTFNLNVATSSANDDEDQEFEFSMLDQADFGGIDAYVKRHGLNDASMAAGRRARKFDVNSAEKQKNGGKEGGAGVGAGGDGEGEEEESELVKAQREMEDREDEEEEDYDPGSEGDSDGSRSDSGGEYGDGDGDGDDGGGRDEEDGDGDGSDLVAEELGSEAEEVEVSDEEEGEEL